MDQVELFEASKPEAESAAPTTPSVNVPELVRHYAENWTRYIECIDAAQALVDGLRGAEFAITRKEYRSAWDWEPVHHQSIDKLVAKVIDAITELACATWCSGDDKVLPCYEGRELAAECGALADETRPDFLLYWSALEAKFGAGAGKQAALIRAAREVRRELQIWPAKPKDVHYYVAPAMERGGVTFYFSWGRWIDKRDRGGYEVSHNGYEQISKICTAIQAVVGDSSFRAERHAKHFFMKRRERVDAPYKADIDGCRWTLLKDNSRLWLPQEFALTLRARLDELDPITSAA